jgi:hypothetical protein
VGLPNLRPQQWYSTHRQHSLMQQTLGSSLAVGDGQAGTSGGASPPPQALLSHSSHSLQIKPSHTAASPPRRWSRSVPSQPHTWQHQGTWRAVAHKRLAAVLVSEGVRDCGSNVLGVSHWPFLGGRMGKGTLERGVVRPGPTVGDDKRATHISETQLRWNQSKSCC